MYPSHTDPSQASGCGTPVSRTAGSEYSSRIAAGRNKRSHHWRLHDRGRAPGPGFLVWFSTMGKA